jgi:adenine-specific DNA methylase
VAEKAKNIALKAQAAHTTAVQTASDYIENFDILETITNVGNDEVFTPRKICGEILDSLPEEVWHNPNYRWLNPCTKNGIFEREIALRLDEGLKEMIPDQEKRRKHILQKMIFSIGLTKFTSHVARRTLYYCNVANKKCDGIKATDGHFVNGYSIGNGSWFDTEEGNILTPNAEHNIQGKDEKAKCTFCGVKESSKYVNPLQREQYAYEFIHVYHLVLEKHLQKRFFKGDKNMKFDIIIGNPPYHLSDGGAQASARPIYHLFIKQAKALNPKYLCMIIPSRWMAGGKGLDDFRDEMINDKHIFLLHDYVDCKQVFPTTEIKGGVCYFVRELERTGKCEIVRHTANGIFKSVRFLKEEGLDVFIRDERLIPIYKKVAGHKEQSFMKIVSPRKPYGLNGDLFSAPSKYGLPPISDKPINDGYTIHGLEGLKRTIKFISNDYPFTRISSLNKYKLFMPRNQGSGFFGEKFSEPILAKPGELCTETYVVIGGFERESECLNIYSYIKTKFFRALIGIRKHDQNASQSIYKSVPLQDFSKSWTDAELYEKYGFSIEEIAFIESNVEAM